MVPFRSSVLSEDRGERPREIRLSSRPVFHSSNNMFLRWMELEESYTLKSNEQIRNGQEGFAYGLIVSCKRGCTIEMTGYQNTLVLLYGSARSHVLWVVQAALRTFERKAILHSFSYRQLHTSFDHWKVSCITIHLIIRKFSKSASLTVVSIKYLSSSCKTNFLLSFKTWEKLEGQTANVWMYINKYVFIAVIERNAGSFFTLLNSVIHHK